MLPKLLHVLQTSGATGALSPGGVPCNCARACVKGVLRVHLPTMGGTDVLFQLSSPREQPPGSRPAPAAADCDTAATRPCTSVPRRPLLLGPRQAESIHHDTKASLPASPCAATPVSPGRHASLQRAVRDCCRAGACPGGCCWLLQPSSGLAVACTQWSVDDRTSSLAPPHRVPLAPAARSGAGRRCCGCAEGARGCLASRCPGEWHRDRGKRTITFGRDGATHSSSIASSLDVVIRSRHCALPGPPRCAAAVALHASDQCACLPGAGVVAARPTTVGTALAALIAGLGT